jgi:hypothetical protein
MVLRQHPNSLLFPEKQGIVSQWHCCGRVHSLFLNEMGQLGNIWQLPFLNGWRFRKPREKANN